jgi:hypothetical protein
MLCLFATIAGAAMAQEQVPRRPSTVSPLPENAEVKIIHAQHNFDLVQNLIAGYPPSLLRMNSVDEEHGLFTVQGSPEAIKQIEEAIAKYDKPAKNIELTFHLVEASNDDATSEIPEEIKPAIAELQRALVYKSYRVLYPVMMRVRDGKSAESSGAMPVRTNKESGEEQSSGPGSYDVRLKSVRLHGDGTRVVSIENMLVQVDGPERVIRTSTSDPAKVRVDRVSGARSSISTNVDVREDQTVVVGKANVDTSDKALFVVLTAHVVEVGP